MVLQRDETGSDLTGTGSLAKEIEYGFTKNMGNYQSERLALRLEVAAEQTPAQAVQQAREWVAENLALSAIEVDELRLEVRELRRQKIELDRSMQHAIQQYARLKAALKKLGLTLPDDLEELPF